MMHASSCLSMKLTKAERLVVEGRRIKMQCEFRAAFSGHAGVVVDWVQATFHKDRLVHMRQAYASLGPAELASAVCRELASIMGFSVGCVRSGRNFYAVTVLMVNDQGSEVGSVSAGNESRQHGTVCISVPGGGCTFGADGWEERLHAWLLQFESKLTRVDLALDWFNGEFTVDMAREGFVAGGFSFQNRAPTPSFHGDWINNTGRTFCVGLRDSGKMCRVYEKGHKLGDPESRWVRVEVELHSTERVLPLSAIVDPGPVFAGAYQYCELMLAQAGVRPVRVPLQQAVGDKSGEAVVRWVERVAAPALAALTRATGSTSWLDEMVWAHKDRPLPKAIRGCGLEHASPGIEKALSRMAGHTGADLPQASPSVPDSEVPF